MCSFSVIQVMAVLMVWKWPFCVFVIALLTSPVVFVIFGAFSVSGYSLSAWLIFCSYYSFLPPDLGALGSEPGDPVPWCRLACGRWRHWKCGTGLIPSSLMFCQLAHFKRGTLVKNIIFLLLTGHSKIAELSLALWVSVCQSLPLTGLNGLAGKGDVSFPCCQFTVSPDHTESEDGRSRLWHHPLVSLELVWSKGLQLLLISFFLLADGDACRLTCRLLSASHCDSDGSANSCLH